ncbi:transcription factor bHLH18-like [Dioscorea cayenensis subsp. rotundata]|uniref:Transcription factor bHLH18-like n=1 Tax=Dioscorea cayennensis subsp. rotundata TaxID=55577 RepID=A0AB40CPB5_DIOCR|nr:transcription factor bHLH18-like [Dioscorea cayenensis subsp. rotundata]
MDERITEYCNSKRSKEFEVMDTGSGHHLLQPIEEERKGSDKNISSCSSSLRFISFGNFPISSSSDHINGFEETVDKMDELETLGSQSAKFYYETSSSSSSRRSESKPPPPPSSSSSSHDHVFAERKRREKLSKLFLNLSTTIPANKKSDKDSLLGNTVNYIKELQSKVKALEQAIETPTESALLVNKKPPLMDMNENSMFLNESSSRSEQVPLKIEAKLNGKSVILNIQCENHKGLIVKAMLEIEKLPMTITNTSILPFGDSLLDIVIMAQVDDGVSVMVKDLVENLNSTFCQILWRCS